MEAEYPGLFFAGNYRGGVSVPNCIASATQLAQRVGDSIAVYGVTKIAMEA